MVGFCHLTDSHHYHHGQKPTMVGICHGGNMPVGHHQHGGQVHAQCCFKEDGLEEGGGKGDRRQKKCGEVGGH